MKTGIVQIEEEDLKKAVHWIYEGLQEKDFSQAQAVTVCSSALCGLLVSSVKSEEMLDRFFRSFEKQVSNHFRESRNGE